MKKSIRKGIFLGAFLGLSVTAYALVRMFYMQDVRSDFTKKQIFEFELNAEMASQELGPGDSFAVSPVSDNTATEEMYVFIEVDMPESNGEPLYTFDANEEWMLVEEDTEHYVYAFGRDELTQLHPGEETTSLTEQMRMREISNAEFADIDDINVTISGFGIDTNGMSTDPERVWEECKAIR